MCIHLCTSFLFHFALCFSDEYETIVNSRDDIAPVGYLRFTKIHLQEKDVSSEYHNCKFVYITIRTDKIKIKICFIRTENWRN